MVQREVPRVGAEEIRRPEFLMKGSGYAARRRADGVAGVAYVAEASFRVQVHGCNVAGMRGDVLFVPSSGNEAWVIKAHDYGEFYETVAP